MRRFAIAVLIVGLSALWVHAGEKEMSMEPYEGSEPFVKLKALAGKWEGTSKMHGQEMKVNVDYRVTSAGSALMETSFPGTPHEMVSVYYDNGKKVSMIHYCSLKNRPEFDSISADPDRIKFKQSKDSLIKKGEHHMNALAVRWIDDDNIVQEWVSKKDGKLQEPTIIKLTRVLE